MSQSLCILHANCQGDAIRLLLEATPAFARLFRIRHYRNYTCESLGEDLGRCTLLLHQFLGEQWGALSTQEVLQRLPGQCRHLELPNLFFKGYWPFWANRGPGEIHFADSLLERLLANGLSPEEVLRLYLHGDTALLGDVAAVAEDSIVREEAKEAGKPIGCAHILRERWREEQLFLTINHPGSELLCYVADSVLRLLGLGPLPASVRAAFRHPHEDFWLPIHPRVGQRLGLPFVTPERRYPIFGRQLTHSQYVSAYLACRQHNVTDLLGFLQNLADDTLSTAHPVSC